METAQTIQMARNETLAETIRREKTRLQNFIRSRVTDASDAEDILQDVFYELVEADRFSQPIEQAGAWLFRVARNKITDLFRKRKPDQLEDVEPKLEDLLPSPEAGPDAVFARNVLLGEIEDALDELPEEQRGVFVAHEIEGRSFKELAEETGVSVNTLLSRKRYAVLHLRARLQDIYDELLKKRGDKL